MNSMLKEYKDNLMELSKEQLIYLIEKLYDSQKLISQTCIEESKLHIDTNEAINNIRGYIYHMPSMIDAVELKVFIDMKMGKISVEDYRKIIGID